MQGRVILAWAQQVSNELRGGTNELLPRFIGIDIDPPRIEMARAELGQAKREGLIHKDLDVSFHCKNALEAVGLIQSATVVFLYLIPRGLKLMSPILSPNEKLRLVLTYMSPLPDREQTRREVITVPHQPGAAWPLFVYET